VVLGEKMEKKEGEEKTGRGEKSERGSERNAVCW
jgi:hypothetical protein